MVFSVRVKHQGDEGPHRPVMAPVRGRFPEKHATKSSFPFLPVCLRFLSLFPCSVLGPYFRDEQGRTKKSLLGLPCPLRDLVQYQSGQCELAFLAAPFPVTRGPES